VILIAYSQHRPEVVEASLDACLAELELEYLDVRLLLDWRS
jgi:L-glyceraldehyde reductase